MFSRLSPTVCCCVLVAAAVPGVLAQGSVDIFVTPILNAPFSGTIHVERSLVQPNGSALSLKTLRKIGRDSHGRIYNESRKLVAASSTETPTITSILLYDPQTRRSTKLNPQRKTFWTAVVDRPPATQPPALLYASPLGGGSPQNEFTKEQDLGVIQIGGVSAHGVREIQTIPGETGGTGQQILIMDEYWYSEYLRINLVIKQNDPRRGSVVMAISDVTLAEPDPALFAIPDDYVPSGSLQAVVQ